MENFEQLVQMIESAREDVEKFERGNKTAGTRVRKAMLAIKNLAHQIRKDISEQKHTEE